VVRLFIYSNLSKLSSPDQHRNKIQKKESEIEIESPHDDEQKKKKIKNNLERIKTRNIYINFNFDLERDEVVVVSRQSSLCEIRKK
jgi:mRNA-degrading endonuclease RelE of RelBE toxin-antitoxin system